MPQTQAQTACEPTGEAAPLPYAALDAGSPQRIPVREVLGLAAAYVVLYAAFVGVVTLALSPAS